MLLKGVIILFSEQLKKLRKERGLTQEQLANLLKISKSAISMYENGNREPNFETEELIADFFNVNISILRGKGQTPIPEGFMPFPKMKKIPLLGTIACGEPILATENIEMYVKVGESIPADFALKCKGDSMINARIFDGDIVYIRQQSDVDDGEIAAVLIGDEATLKKVHKFPNKIVLSPCNPMYDDLVYSNEQLDEIRILGKAVAFFSIIR